MKRLILLLLVVALAAYLFWRESTGFEGRLRPSSDLVYEMIGTDQGAGNLIGIQPYLVPSDYASEERFRQKIETYLAPLAKQKLFGEKSIVVFPEYLGTWLLAANEKNSVYEATTASDAITAIVLRHPYQFLKDYLLGKEEERTAATIFRMKGEEMAYLYQRVFSTLASKYKITIVAGSILLPEPSLDAKGKLEVEESGPLYNISVIFGPNGAIQSPLVRKVFPVSREKAFMSSGKPDQVPVFDTSAGRLAVLVCADAWYPQAYDMISNQQVKMLAIPSDMVSDSVWLAPWGGYDPGPAPKDADAADIHKITEAAAWKKYSMAGRAGAVGVGWGINVFLRGKMWDMGSDGHTLTLQGGHVAESVGEGDLITVLWLRK